MMVDKETKLCTAHGKKGPYCYFNFQILKKKVEMHVNDLFSNKIDTNMVMWKFETKRILPIKIIK